MSVFHVIAFHGLKVGVEAAFVVAHGEVAVPWVHVFVDAGACGKLPLGLGGEAERLYVDAVLAERAAQEVGAPVGECIGLLPADTYHGIVVVASVREIHAYVRLVIGILEVVYPCGGVGVDIHYISVEEVVGAGESTRNGRALDNTVLVDEGGVF